LIERILLIKGETQEEEKGFLISLLERPIKQCCGKQN